MALQDKSPLDWAWFIVRDYDNRTGTLLRESKPFYMNVGMISAYIIPLFVQKAMQAERVEVWIYEASHTDPTQNIWRIFSRS